MEMIVLAFDTSVTGCSVCVGDNGKCWSETIETERGQAESLVPMINDVVRRSDYSYNDFDRVAVTIGPGSFTGVRVGLSAAKAMALSLNKPLLGFSTLEIIAGGYKGADDILALIDTKRGDYYGQVFLSGKEAAEPPRIWSEEEVKSSSYKIIRDVLPEVELLAKRALVFETAETTYQPQSSPAPLYLRGAEVSQSKRIAPKIVRRA